MIEYVNIFFQSLELSIWVAALAGLLQFFGYFLYAKDMIGGHNRPNPAAWMLWAVGNGIDLISYQLVAQDWIKNILPISCAISAIGIFILALARGKWDWREISKFDWFLIIADIVIVALAWMFDQNEIGHIFVLADTILIYIFVIRDCKEDPEAETFAPWFVWTCAYIVMLMAVILRFDTWWAVGYPVVNFIMCAWVLFLIRNSRRKHLVA
ncbi:MAG: hypothetical protein RL150_735 [Candidatus Parcubacteria bacterium]|jgi:hypothetical protein